MPSYVQVIIATFASYVLMFLIAKILGKKQIAELSFADYVVGITIGSIAAEWSTDTSQSPWHHYVIAMAIYGGLSLLIDILERKALPLKRFLRGNPIIIIEDGKINYKNLKKAKLSLNDIISMARAKGFFDLSNVSFAIFENNGELSIVPTAEKSMVHSGDLNIEKPEPELTKYLVIDGALDKNYLKQIKKTKKWAYDVLQIKTKKELKNIALAKYDLATKQKVIHYKTN